MSRTIKFRGKRLDNGQFKLKATYSVEDFVQGIMSIYRPEILEEK